MIETKIVIFDEVFMCCTQVSFFSKCILANITTNTHTESQLSKNGVATLHFYGDFIHRSSPSNYYHQNQLQ